MQILAIKQFMPNLTGVFFDEDALGIYYSYTTVIGYVYRGEVVLSQTQFGWRNIAGRHLNYFNADKKVRIPHSQVLAQLQAILDNLN